jgi:hypothetical protein
MWSGSRSNRVSKIESIQSLDNEFAEYRTNEIRKEIAKTESLVKDESLWSGAAADLFKFRELEKKHADDQIPSGVVSCLS